MKNILKRIILFMLLSFPFGVLAAGSVSVYPTSLTIEAGSTKTFTITATNAVGEVSITSSNVNVAKVSVNNWETGAVEEGQTKSTTVTVTGVSAGTATITLAIDAATFDEENISGTKTVNVTVKKTSTNNNLSSLKVNGTSVPNFSPSTTTYTVNVDSETAEITATPEDSAAKVTSGTGSKTLKYGKNQYEIKVTAESGSVKTYTLVINRNDNRDTNNNLSSLTVDKGTLSFNKNTTSYRVNVDTDVDKITINAVAESTKAKIDSNSIGIKNLKLGDNKFEIKVTAENGNVKTYVVTVNRKDNRDSNNYLSSLSIDKGTLSFNKNITSYNVNVENDIEKIVLTAIVESAKAKVSGDGEKTLKVGSNKFEIKVTAENETVKTYTVTIIRADKDAANTEKLIKSLTIEGIDITFDPNIYNYSINIGNQESLNFNYELESGVSATITGNEFLKNNSIIILKLTKDEVTQEYTFNVYKEEQSSIVVPSSTNNKKKSNWIIYVIIGVILFAIIGFLAKKKDKSIKKEEKIDQTPNPSGLDSLTNDATINNNQIDNIEKLDL